MRERLSEQRVASAPQWENLFLAPAYRGEAAERAEEDWQEGTAAVSVGRRRRQGGRRVSRPAA
ncbi:hypothetical protein OIE75_39155 [Streptomyces sp. NBC_01723]|uniref:hypothetical protein n=1 Tax=Streptomyces sp. NBC_01723 TaxID=2975921 RepID=UPI002E3649F0|nr:hypothetical protein [Streptomyces sp. NBC_01723]